MKPFHTAVGAVGYLEQFAQGATGVLVITGNPKTMKLQTNRVVFDRVVTEPRYNGDQGWAPVYKQVVK